MAFADEYGNLLPKGTAIDLQPFSPHSGVIGYTATGEQVVGHNSKQHGRAVITWPHDFNDGHIPVRIVAFPKSSQHADQIWRSVLSDVARGVPWRGGDNCQDLVSRAYTGQNGSATRDGIFGVFVLLGATVVAAKVLSRAG
jgi:hypothetical protein